MAASEPEPASDSDLYQVDPSQFTAARNELAKRVRADGRRDEADRIAKLRRPPVTAWALNQVARRQPDVIAAVLDAGLRSRSAMEKAVGGDASTLRDAQSGQRRAVEAAVAAAVECLETAGHPGGDTTRQRLAETLGAAVVDDEVAQQLREGVLDGDRSAPGFGLDGMSLPGPRISQAPETRAEGAASGPRVAADKKRGRAERVQEKEQDDKARRATLAAQRERRRQARARYAELQAEAGRLATRAERLNARAEDAERRAAEARAAAVAARDEADQARCQADDARPDPADEPVE